MNEQDEPAEPGRYVEIYRGSDVFEMQMLTDALGARGFDTRLSGSLSGAAIGAGQIVGLSRLLVAEHQELPAANALAELLGMDGPCLPGALSKPDDDGSFAPLPGALTEPVEDGKLTLADDFELPRGAPRPRGQLLAGALSLLAPGAGHAYAGQPWFGMTLLAGVGLLYFFVAGPRYPAAWLAIAAVWVFSVPLAVLAARQTSRGPTPHQAMQMLAAVALVLATFGLAQLAFPHLAPGTWAEQREIVIDELVREGDQAKEDGEQVRALMAFQEAAEMARETCLSSGPTRRERAYSCGVAAELYLQGHAETPPGVDATVLAEQGCQDGDAFACELLGWWYQSGRAGTGQVARSGEYFSKACGLGSTPACRMVSEKR